MLEIRERGTRENAARLRVMFMGFWCSESMKRAKVIKLLLKNEFAKDEAEAGELLDSLINKRIEYDQAMFFEITEVSGVIKFESGDYCRDIC